MSSREYKGKRIVVWPIYLDATVPRSKGRRVPIRIAVKNPRVEEIVRAAQALGLDPIVEDKSYPRQWWSEGRRVTVLKKGSKLQTLKLIAETIRGMRSKRAPQ